MIVQVHSEDFCFQQGSIHWRLAQERPRVRYDHKTSTLDYEKPKNSSDRRGVLSLHYRRRVNWLCYAQETASTPRQCGERARGDPIPFVKFRALAR